MIAVYSAVLLSCAPIATDGDTFRCGNERIRILAIDAPELGACKPAGRVCVVGDPKASRATLAAVLKNRPLEIERVGKDRYGRTLAVVTAGGLNVSCYQIRMGSAVYVSKWDKGRRIRKACIV